MYLAAPIFILATCYFAYVMPLKCVICNSENNNVCAEGTPDQLNQYSAECSAVNKSMGGAAGVEWTSCRKIVTFVDFDVNDEKGGITRVFRRCGYIKEEKLSCVYKGGLGGRQRVCSCDTDNCNSGHSLTNTLLTTILAPIAIVAIYRFQQ